MTKTKHRASPKANSAVVRRNPDGTPAILGPATHIGMPATLSLTRAERKKFGLWDGDYIRDAQGLKRITLLKADRARAEDDLVAAGDLSVDGKVYRFERRFDLPAGSTFEFELSE